jgi:trimeric autotransporter adhesin
MITELDRVVRTEPVAKKSLKTGDVGTVVHVDTIRLACVCIAGLLIASCGGSASPSAPASPSVPLSINVSPAVLGIGELGQANAVAGAGPVTWSSGAPGVAAVTADGVVRALARGTADIRGQTPTQSATWPLRVLAGDEVTLSWAVLGRGGVRGDDFSVVWTVSVGETVSLTPRASFDRTNLSVSVYDVLPATRLAWASSNPVIVSVTPSGQMTGRSRGVADVTATWLGKVGSVRVTVE